MDTRFGLPVSTTSMEIAAALDHFHHQIIASGPLANDILSTAENNPQEVLVQVYSAAFYLYGQNSEATALARTHLLKAEKYLSSANLREQLFFEAVKSWMNLDYDAAIIGLTALIRLYPRDTLALKFSEWLFYCTGQAYQAKRYLALCESMVNENKTDPHFLAMYSFALELSGHLTRACAVAQEAVAIERVSPWAHHTLAHYYLNTNQIESGRKHLEDFKPTWDSILPLLKGHNTWHIALFYLAMRDEEQVMLLFPQIFGSLPELCTEQLDGISLLWRLELAGLPQAYGTTYIAQYLDNYPYEQYTGFNNIHYIYCLARAEQEAQAQRAIESVMEYARNLPQGKNHYLWQHIILPFCQATYAYTHDDYPRAHQLLAPIIMKFNQLGGSDAQGELFTQTYLTCLLKLHKKDEARKFFLQYLPHYRGTALESYWFQ
ncbi:tetratricopeptide repeat protein [Legionella taurinensis]|uniref:Tetratricopeptide repeat protein 38 n=1 Tax=Legionella taurinensis TaxID=70611 RepID=A0A3A5L707_9GAMM|nr:tetratricopeptide repeat protein [Legionella taurinensis]RJT46626.1 tetratricopeptide repeat protein [Legionella taurinensis]RJT66598.1 tetratricopeptide repeat protein [Legionella taurinensis]STY25245.1 Uncharacterised protein [Legionella taurinensis]